MLLKDIDIDNSYNIKLNKDEIKNDTFSLNLTENTNNMNMKSNNIILPEKPQNNKNDLYKDKLNFNGIILRNKTLSEKKIQHNSIDKNNFSTLDYNSEKGGGNNNNNSKENPKKTLYITNKNNSKQKKNRIKSVIHSIDHDNINPNVKGQFQGHNKHLNNQGNYNYKDKDKNLGIKLIKNKIQKNKNSKLMYIKESSPTLNLYKEYYDKKIKKQKEEEKLDEINKIPKRVSPAFWRTAYSKFDKEQKDKNLKSYNPNMNIIIDNIDEFLNKSKNIYTINGAVSHKINSKSNKKNNINKDNINNSSMNISV